MERKEGYYWVKDFYQSWIVVKNWIDIDGDEFFNIINQEGSYTASDFSYISPDPIPSQEEIAALQKENEELKAKLGNRVFTCGDNCGCPKGQCMIDLDLQRQIDEHENSLLNNPESVTNKQ